jgi:phosphoribosylanthranilate isomerase
VIFAGGPREVSLAQAREIVAAAAGRPVFGVFGGQSAAEILRIRDLVGLSGAQLHRTAEGDDPRRLMNEGMLVLQVLHLAGPDDLAAADSLAAGRIADAVLVEPRVEGRLGGTGMALPLELAEEARRRIRGVRFFLAGGLTPETVNDAIARIRPDAVDVSSGVEQIPGIKDHERLARFMEAAGGQHSPA